ncbi:MAG: threonine ammonia-lyase [Candidatus Nanohaloarchaea archaeon]
MTTQNYATTTETRQKSGDSRLVSLEEVEEARRRLEDVAKKTPLDTSSTFAELSGAESVGLKLENLQRTGAFKIRGAYNELSQLSEEQKDRGVIAASSGNHAQGVALAAQELGVDATIVMPEGTPDSKVKATKSYGAEVVRHGEVYDDAYEKARELQESRGLEFVHPYDDREVVAGQGTLGLEMLEQFPELDTVFVAVGGGGLVSGVAVALKSLKPDVKVVGVQTEGCGTAKETLESGTVYRRDETDTIADGIETRHVGELAAEHFQEYVDEVVYVSDDETAAAMKLLAEREKTVAEPAGAVAAAAVLFAGEHGLDLSGRNVAVPVCGGNVDLDEFPGYCKRGGRFLGDEL